MHAELRGLRPHLFEMFREQRDHRRPGQIIDHDSHPARVTETDRWLIDRRVSPRPAHAIRRPLPRTAVEQLDPP
ncbi:hypothetical protein IU443_17730 [Nocardia farcinica]|uniref:hypothetical protein n=1 Tax=Nocardia farcinica TaxID=37329 RepID=UPI001894A4B2|nr:hypothetical protein [Nocardia farcinica]MBF6291747.1 hypothetical protein [Nocardia farcinica]MBF6305142.1 hypothetical protein [Nocardia farcinica]MBF6391789.1 hypothetical protein [Nocardia farcinica]